MTSDATIIRRLDEDCQRVSNEVELSALDGKHIALYVPHHAGSKYYNYKNIHSILLMALVDADYKFIYIDVGCNGRISDGGVFAGCSLSEALDGAIANVPADAPLSDDDEENSQDGKYAETDVTKFMNFVKTEMKQVLSHPLGPIPWALANGDGSLRKTDKAKFMNDTAHNVPVAEMLPDQSACIVEAMSTIQEWKAKGKHSRT